MIINIYFKTFFNTRKKISETSLYFIIFILSCGILLIVKYNIPILNLAYFFFILIVYSLIYTGNIKLKLLTALIYTTGVLISETLGLTIVACNHETLYLPSIVLSVSIRVLIAFFLVKFNQNIILIANKYYTWFCGLLFMVIGGCIILMHFINGSGNFLSSVLSVILLFILLGITLSCFYITSTFLIQQQRTQLQEAVYRKEYYKLLKQHYDKTKMSQTENAILTSNYIVNYVCSNKFQIAKESHIQIHSEFMLPNFLDMDTTDLSALYENLLDNAIAACQSLNREDRNIYFYTSYHLGQLYIKIYNPYINNENELELNPNNEHGLCLMDVKQMVNKYHGFLDIKKENHIFEVDLVLYLHEDMELNAQK